MSDFFEIDFLDIESAKSGDAIPLRYRDRRRDKRFMLWMVDSRIPGIRLWPISASIMAILALSTG